MKSQKQVLHDYLKKHKSITYMESFGELGIARLAARIKDLRSEGVQIETVMEKVISNKTGREHTVAVYYLHESSS